MAPMTINSALTHAEAERLAARIAELEHERKHLLAVIEILKEASSSLHFIDILQSTARKLGESFGLDRCSIFLGEKGGKQVRLVASYEDPRRTCLPPFSPRKMEQRSSPNDSPSLRELGRAHV